MRRGQCGWGGQACCRVGSMGPAHIAVAGAAWSTASTQRFVGRHCSRSAVHTAPWQRAAWSLDAWAMQSTQGRGCLCPHLDEGSEPGIQVPRVQLGQRHQPLPVVPLPLLCREGGGATARAAGLRVLLWLQHWRLLGVGSTGLQVAAPRPCMRPMAPGRLLAQAKAGLGPLHPLHPKPHSQKETTQGWRTRGQQCVVGGARGAPPPHSNGPLQARGGQEGNQLGWEG